jgi:hypothetical protein
MRKLTGISSGENNKSCRVTHRGSNKIGFTFFWFFCDFLCNLKESGNHFNYWSSPFAMTTLEKSLCLQCSPRGAVAGAGWPNSGGSPRVLAGEGYGGDLGTLGAWFGRSAGAVVAPASRCAGGQ